MAHVITQPCCNDATCVAVCPVDAIHPTPEERQYKRAEMLYIDPENCIDCGACVDVCPVSAISHQDDLPGEFARYAELNALYFQDNPARAPQPTPPTGATVTAPSDPLRVAVVGSGPAAFYAAEELMRRRDLDVEVHMFERLPTPWGLVRFGVAPDHPETTDVARLFRRTSARKGFSLHLNVDVGTDISHEELLAYHHAVLYAVGAPGDRRLGVPGEDLRGSHSATDFVAWYNGHPDFAHRSFDLSGERAVVVGNGNVALDVARILVADPRQLAHTDLADHALRALETSRIREVVVLGRRGPAQAAYTTPELLALRQLSGVDVVADPEETKLDRLTTAMLESNPDAMATYKARVAHEFAQAPLRQLDRRIRLRFLSSPVELVGEDRVRALRAVRNEFVCSPDGRLELRATGQEETLECSLVLRAVGYQGRPLPGLPFDGAHATLPNESGRVMDPATAEPVTGVYTAGWIKRGPSGVIGTNRHCAEETVHALVEDHLAGRLTAPRRHGQGLDELIRSRQPDALDYAQWKALDIHERSLGREQGRPRVKLVDSAKMIEVAQRPPMPS